MAPASGDSNAVPAEWTACQTDADCTAVEMGCCDHCNGGWVLGVNQASVKAATEHFHADCGAAQPPDATGSFSGVQCTELGCGQVKGMCGAGTCTWALDVRMDGRYEPQPNVVRQSP